MDLSQITLTQMRYAVAVADKANFRQAAAHCAVSQSGLSMQIQKLEEMLGVTLFDRKKKPILFTQAGRAAVAQMRTVLQDVERLGQVVSSADEPQGLFRFGVIPTLSATTIPLFLGVFLEQYPRVELIIEELQTEEMIARLKNDTLDAGLAATPLAIDGIDERVLGLETMFAYLPPGDSLLKKNSISEKSLRARPLWVMPEGHCFRTQVLSFCRQ
ncbi:MAG: LysR family transcriptional regulator, partial [Polyangiaceae bacterium]|nr:LysR family transcriptional regulator [Polyangiaceae bacterium]